jgi:ribose/xylose/arabinose/galactoside ABC-type transport system permease subunit
MVTNTEKEIKAPVRIRQKRKIPVSTELLLLALILAILIFMRLTTDTFFSAYNIGNLFKASAIAGIIAISSTFVIITGGIDLSVGSIAGLTAMISAVLMSSERMGWPILPAVIIAIIIGTSIGFYHGFMIYDFRLPPFIATLGTMFIVRGVVELISQAQTISGLPESFNDFSQASLFGIPWLVIVWLGLAIIGQVVLHYTHFGRNAYVIGSSQEVARLSGIRMRLNVYGVYILAAFLCSVAGVLLTSRINSAVPTGGQGYELTAIAAAVVGGASLSGARGSVIGTVLGTFLITLITSAGVHLKIDPFVMQIVTGALLTIAVVADQLRQRRK